MILKMILVMRLKMEIAVGDLQFLQLGNLLHLSETVRQKRIKTNHPNIIHRKRMRKGKMMAMTMTMVMKKRKMRRKRNQLVYPQQ